MRVRVRAPFGCVKFLSAPHSPLRSAARFNPSGPKIIVSLRFASLVPEGKPFGLGVRTASLVRFEGFMCVLQPAGPEKWPKMSHTHICSNYSHAWSCTCFCVCSAHVLPDVCSSVGHACALMWLHVQMIELHMLLLMWTCID